MHKSATKCNKTIGKWCKNKHGASKIIDTLETYQTTNGHDRRRMIEETDMEAKGGDPAITITMALTAK
jgi:hypothetical protein